MVKYMSNSSLLQLVEIALDKRGYPFFVYGQF